MCYFVNLQHANMILPQSPQGMKYGSHYYITLADNSSVLQLFVHCSWSH